VDGSSQLRIYVRDFTHEHLSYTWVETARGADAYALEAVLAANGIGRSLPCLNSCHPEEA